MLARLLARGAVSKLHICPNSWENLGDAFLDITGSLAVLLVWIYYSAQLILLGAEFTRCYATRFGHWVVATKGAVAAPETPLARLAAEKHVKNDHEAKAAGKGTTGPI